jgi:hypothetical protein
VVVGQVRPGLDPAREIVEVACSVDAVVGVGVEHGEDRCGIDADDQRATRGERLGQRGVGALRVAQQQNGAGGRARRTADRERLETAMCEILRLSHRPRLRIGALQPAREAGQQRHRHHTQQAAAAHLRTISRTPPLISVAASTTTRGSWMPPGEAR